MPRPLAAVVPVVAITLAVAGRLGSAQTTAPTSRAIVSQWIEAINALSDAPETLDRFVALYADDALHITGPSTDQRGTATYRGPRGLRAWAVRIATRETKRSYRLETETARETTASLFHETAGPWGGPAVAVQIVATYTDTTTEKRYAVPGAVFFQIANGKIHRTRLLFGDGERSEVEPEPTRRRP